MRLTNYLLFVVLSAVSVVAQQKDYYEKARGRLVLGWQKEWLKRLKHELDFVEHVQGRYVGPISLQNVDKLVDGDIFSQNKFGATDSVFLADEPRNVDVHPLRLLRHFLNVYT